MLTQDDLIEIENWDRDHYGDYICEWVYELSEDSAKPKWEAFAITVQEQKDSTYQISVAVSSGGGVGDLLSADYSESSRTVEEAMAIAEEFAKSIEVEYIN